MKLGEVWKADQRRWAHERCCLHDSKGYVSSLDHNLFQPMSRDTQDDFLRGSGGELRPRRGAAAPKMHALHSSSILACNVFDYWRSRILAPIAGALGGQDPFGSLAFEQQFPTGLPGQPPNLDVALRSARQVWAIESKFTEPFGAIKRGPAFKAKYFPSGQPVWLDRGLTSSAALALRLQNGEAVFRHLDSAQLLKHALGLQTNQPACFVLVYLYADGDGPEAAQHRSEVDEFGAAIGSDFPFVPLSYNTFLARLGALAGADHASYFRYLDERYSFTARRSVA